MKTFYVLTVAAVVIFLATAQGEDYRDNSKEFEDESQDFLTNRVKEWRRRQQLRSMFDPNCLVWTRRNSNCFSRKRSYNNRQVSFLLLLS